MLEGALKIPPEWREAAEEVGAQGGPVLVMGAPGSGKTTFCLYLAGLYCRAGKRLAWLDADPGQPFIGPPAVISLTPYAEAADLLKRKNAFAMSFIGNTSPVGRLLEMMSGLQKLYTLAQSLQPDLILINTCGLVNGGAARELKFHEIDMIAPRYVIALQKENEVDHLLSPHSHRAGLLIQRLPVSPDAKVSTREARQAVREQRFKEYFRGADFHDINLNDVGVHGPGLGTGERLGFRDINRLSKIVKGIVVHAELSADRLFLVVEGEYAGDELFTAKEQYKVREVEVLRRSEIDHLLVGLNDDRNICLGIGILRAIDLRELAIRVITPVRDTAQVRNVSLGSIRVSPAGGELGQI
ncbi:MAG TPA: Clp1/GlmU family protein [Nitrospirota bacterium]|nr:Clp1/GlmU family protein [Nitrospirota bacterium]